MYNLISLKLRTQIFQASIRMFHCDAVDTSPYLRVKMSQKPSKWLFDKKGGRQKRNLTEFSVTGFIFSYVQKYVMALTGAIALIASPWIRH